MRPDQAHALIEELRRPEIGTLRAESIREQIIREHQGLVRHFIKVHDRQSIDDLVQLGNIGLIQAIDKFDLERGIAFSTFAGIHIRGEISHYLRDQYQTIRIPRDLQKNLQLVSASIEALMKDLERSPTVAEISIHSGLSTGTVLDALETLNTRDMKTLSEPINWDLPSTTDQGFNSVEAWATIQPALELLSSQDRSLLGMRFAEGLTNTEIAKRTGLSQVNVGRQLHRILNEVRRDTGEL
jgi:RNA polymerase sigma-B factor